MKKINETFECVNCKKEIPLANRTCRNHCPFCFVSLHVDGDIPWDRSADCHWRMIPTSYKLANWTIKIDFECVKCKKHHRNKLADDDNFGELDSAIKTLRGILTQPLL
jgi:DNA-directed RNA polymerase subunit RPC12/RpoP